MSEGNEVAFFVSEEDSCPDEDEKSDSGTRWSHLREAEAISITGLPANHSGKSLKIPFTIKLCSLYPIRKFSAVTESDKYKFPVTPYILILSFFRPSEKELKIISATGFRSRISQNSNFSLSGSAPSSLRSTSMDPFDEEIAFTLKKSFSSAGITFP